MSEKIKSSTDLRTSLEKSKKSYEDILPVIEEVEKLTKTHVDTTQSLSGIYKDAAEALDVYKDAMEAAHKSEKDAQRSSSINTYNKLLKETPDTPTSVKRIFSFSTDPKDVVDTTNLEQYYSNLIAIITTDLESEISNYEGPGGKTLITSLISAMVKSGMSAEDIFSEVETLMGETDQEFFSHLNDINQKLVDSLQNMKDTADTDSLTGVWGSLFKLDEAKEAIEDLFDIEESASKIYKDILDVTKDREHAEATKNAIIEAGKTGDIDKLFTYQNEDEKFAATLSASANAQMEYWGAIYRYLSDSADGDDVEKKLYDAISKKLSNYVGRDIPDEFTLLTELGHVDFNTLLQWVKELKEEGFEGTEAYSEFSKKVEALVDGVQNAEKHVSLTPTFDDVVRFLQDTSNYIEEAVASTKDFEDALSDLKDDSDGLASAYESMRDNGSISVQQAYDIVSTYKDGYKYITYQNGAYKVSIDF